MRVRLISGMNCCEELSLVRALGSLRPDIDCNQIWRLPKGFSIRAPSRYAASRPEVFENQDTFERWSDCRYPDPTELCFNNKLCGPPTSKPIHQFDSPLNERFLQYTLFQMDGVFSATLFLKMQHPKQRPKLPRACISLIVGLKTSHLKQRRFLI